MPHNEGMGTEEQTMSGDGVATASETLTITDNRTGRTYEVPIEDGTIRALALRDIKVEDDDFGLMTYDPAYMNTASCRSAITYIDGDKGVLEYRGYPIEQLAEQSSYLEVAYLLVHGELPTQAQLDEWEHEITIHTFVHENVKKFMEGYRYDAHPMGMLCSSVAALSTFYPDAPQIKDPDIRYSHVIRLIAKMPTLAAFAYRHNMGQPYVYPDNDLRYPGNFLNMLLQDDRAQVPAGSAAGAGARHPVHPARRPRAELLDLGRALGRLLAGRPLLGGRGRRRPRSTARSTAAPTRRCCGCCAGSSRRTTSPTSCRA